MLRLIKEMQEVDGERTHQHKQGELSAVNDEEGMVTIHFARLCEINKYRIYRHAASGIIIVLLFAEYRDGFRELSYISDRFCINLLCEAGIELLGLSGDQSTNEFARSFLSQIDEISMGHFWTEPAGTCNERRIVLDHSTPFLDEEDYDGILTKEMLTLINDRIGEHEFDVLKKDILNKIADQMDVPIEVRQSYQRSSSPRTEMDYYGRGMSGYYEPNYLRKNIHGEYLEDVE